MVEAPLIIQQRNNVPQALYDQCRDLGLPISGNAAGHASTTDLDGLPLGPFPQVLGWHAKGIGAMAGCVILFYLILFGMFCETDFSFFQWNSCVLTAVIGMVAVGWYPLGGQISDEDMEDEVRERMAAKRSRGRFFGLVGKKS